MQSHSNRSIVVISGLLTLLLLGGATLAVALQNGWLHLAPPAPTLDAVPARAQPATVNAITVDRGAADSEATLYRSKLEEAYGALDDAYAQIQSLSPVPRQVAFRGDDDGRSIRNDDESREHQSRRRESDDD